NYAIVTLGSESVSVEMVETPATPMLLLEDTWGEGGWRTSAAAVHIPDGAEIRFRYNVRPEDLETAKRAAEQVRAQLLTAGASSVKLDDVVIATVRARAPEVAAATTIGEKLMAMWKARDEMPD